MLARAWTGDLVVLLILIPVALSLGLLGLGAFMWSLKTGQYDDLEGARWRILDDDDLPEDAVARHTIPFDRDGR